MLAIAPATAPSQKRPGAHDALILRGKPGVELRLPQADRRGIDRADGRFWCLVHVGGATAEDPPRFLLRQASSPAADWKGMVYADAHGVEHAALCGEPQASRLHLLWSARDGEVSRVLHRVLDTASREWLGAAQVLIEGASQVDDVQLGDVVFTEGGSLTIAVFRAGGGAELRVLTRGAKAWAVHPLEVEGRVVGVSLAAAGPFVHVVARTAGADDVGDLIYRVFDEKAGSYVKPAEAIAFPGGLHLARGLPCSVTVDAAGVPCIAYLAGKRGDDLYSLHVASLSGSKISAASEISKVLGRSWEHAPIADGVASASAPTVGTPFAIVGTSSGGVAAVYSKLADDRRTLWLRAIAATGVGEERPIGEGKTGRFAQINGLRLAGSKAAGACVAPLPREDRRTSVGFVAVSAPGAARVGDLASERREGRRRLARSGRSTVGAIDRGLAWLERHQDKSGRWDADEFMKHDTDGVPCDSPGNPLQDVGVTGLALLAFLAEGNTPERGPHADVVRRAVDWLLDIQRKEGEFRVTEGNVYAGDAVFGHAIATLALAEVCALAGHQLIRDPKPRVALRNALDSLERHRNPYMVWRYGMRDNDNDTAVTAWCVQAYVAARDAGFAINPQAMQLAATWFDQVTDPQTGRCGYSKRGDTVRYDKQGARFPPDRTETLAAIGLHCRFLFGQNPDDQKVMQRAADLLLTKPPRWDEKAGCIDHYYWFYGSQALFQTGGRHWKQWSKALSAAVVATQREDGNHAGSWDPIGAWGMFGGRVYSTALLTLTLQTPYRRPPRPGR